MLQLLLLKPLLKKYCILYMGERMPVLRGSMKTAQSKWTLHFKFIFFLISEQIWHEMLPKLSY